MAQTANQVWADGPAGSPTQPNKADVRAWGTWLESFVTAIATNTGTIFQTRAALYANLAFAANTLAWVMNDPTVAYNGLYQKSGVSGSGSWARIGDLPYSFITAVDAGAGTPNAVVATSSIPISASALVIVNVFQANTGSPVTIAFNGGSALTLKTNTGSNIAAGGLVAGMQLLGVVSGSTFRLVSDQVSSAIVAAAEAAANAAAASATAANTSAGNAATSETNAQKWAVNPEDVVVSGGLYSAFHWAQKAAAVVTGGIAAAIHAATAKTALDDNDELGAADSAASWGLKKFTLANLIASIFKTGRVITNASFAAASLRIHNAATGFYQALDATALTAARTRKLANKDLDEGKLKQITVLTGVDLTAGGATGVNLAIDPAADMIRIDFEGLSTTSTDQVLIQLGTSSGLVTTGYDAGAYFGSSSPGAMSNTVGFPITGLQAARAMSGSIVLRKGRNNVWMLTFEAGRATGLAEGLVGGGTVTLSGPITQVQIARSASATFDGGYITGEYRT